MSDFFFGSALYDKVLHSENYLHKHKLLTSGYLFICTIKKKKSLHICAVSMNNALFIAVTGLKTHLMETFNL